MADDLTNEAQNQPATPEVQASKPTPPPAEAALEAPSFSKPQPAAPESRGPQRRRRGEGQPGQRGARGGRPGHAFAAEPGEVDEMVVKIYRCATVVRGGRRFSFAALVVVGDRNGRVGIGYGKANEVPNAVEKGGKIARRSMVGVSLAGTTIPHKVLGHYGASKVLLIPAGEGTGVIAGTSVRAVMELAGVKDVLTKSYGSNSPKNLVKAAFAGLRALRSKEEIYRLREVSIP